MTIPTPDPNSQPQYVPPTASGLPGPGEPFNGAVSPEDLSRPLYGASFVQAVRRFFQNYVNFNGRASRSEYWWSALFVFLLQLIPSILYSSGLGSMINAAAYSNAGGVSPLFVVGIVLMILIGLATLLPMLGLSWRRLHDGNFAGPLYFLALIPYVGSLAVFVLMLMPPKPAGRRFDTA